MRGADISFAAANLQFPAAAPEGCYQYRGRWWPLGRSPDFYFGPDRLRPSEWSGSTAYAQADSNFDCGTFYAHAYTNSYRYGHDSPYPNRHPNTCAPAHLYPLPYHHTHAYTNDNADAHAYLHAYAYPTATAHAYLHAYAYPNTYADEHTHAYTHAGSQGAKVLWVS